MNRKAIRVSAALLALFSVLMLLSMPAAKAAPSVPASSMALIELETGTLLASANCDERLAMASTTKIMTALIVLENCDLTETVKVTDEAVGVEGSSIYLKKGEELTVRDLLYGLMLSSGNDAAVALAVHVGGSKEAFVDMMNKKVRDLGLANTRFVTPNGLDAVGHYTTARELCLIAREALKYDEFREIVSTKYYSASSGSTNRTFKNKNSLLWSYEGAFGVKTGYTSVAGRCLVFGAERDGMAVVGAVLNCRPMFESAEELLDYAFDSFYLESVISGSSHVGETFVDGSVEKVLELETKESIIVVMKKGEDRSFRLETELNDSIRAPLRKGDAVGMLRVFDGETEIGSTELIASNDLNELNFGYWLRLLFKAFISS